MAQDSWAEIYEPLELLESLREPSPHYSEARRSRHIDLLNTYTLRCLIGIGADNEADIFREYTFGFTGNDSDELVWACEDLEAQAGQRARDSYGQRSWHTRVHAQRARATLAAINALGGYEGSPWWAAVAVTKETQHLLQREQCTWLRCLFSNPHGHSVVERDWLTSTVIDLVRGIAAEDAFDRLPILADALQDAGCDNEELLDHCRSDVMHRPHCWAVTAIFDAIDPDRG